MDKRIKLLWHLKNPGIKSHVVGRIIWNKIIINKIKGKRPREKTRINEK